MNGEQSKGGSHPSLHIISEEQLKKQLETHEIYSYSSAKPIFMLFYNNIAGGLEKRVLHAWNNVNIRRNGNERFMHVDCSINSDICSQFTLPELPAALLLKNYRQFPYTRFILEVNENNMDDFLDSDHLSVKPISIPLIEVSNIVSMKSPAITSFREAILRNIEKTFVIFVGSSFVMGMIIALYLFIGEMRSAKRTTQQRK